MKVVLTTVFMVASLLLSCGANASSVTEANSIDQQRILRAYGVELEDARLIKFPVGPSATGVITEITLSYMRSYYAKEELFKHTTAKLADGTLNVYVLNLVSEPAIARNEHRYTELVYYPEILTIRVDGFYDLSNINLINLESEDILMPTHFNRVYTLDAKIKKSVMTDSGTVLIGHVTTIGCLDKLAKVEHYSLVKGDGYELIMAPIVLEHKDSARVLCVAPNIETFSILVGGVLADLHEFSFNYLK